MTLAVIEAEQSIIGCAMYAAGDCADAFERLRPEQFYDPVHQRLWAAIIDCMRRGKTPEPVTLCGMMGSDAPLADLGGMAYLAKLIDHAVAWTIPAHIDAICDRASRRAIQALTRDIQARAGDTSDGDADMVLADLERGAAEIARDGSDRPNAVPVGLSAVEMVEAAYNGDFAGSSTGLGVLDHVTGGVRQDDVWFIGGRTSMGKSVMGLALARGIAEQGRGVMMFSLEMPMREVQARLIADLAYDRRIPNNGQEGGNVKYGDILKGRGAAGHQDRAKAAARTLASLPLTVNDAGGLTIEDIRHQAARQMRAWDKSGVPRGAILIDHIGLVRPHKSRGDSKAAETADVVNELKGIAKQLRAPVIALCQVNRNTESRNDKRPTLADLNWSGAIEQIADFICLLYRPAYYLERSSNEEEQMEARRVENDLDLLIQKNRSGPICNLTAYVNIACNAIRDRDDHARAYG